MKHTRRYIAAFCILVLTALVACSFTVDLGNQAVGTPTSQLSALDQISTKVAATLQIFTQQALSATPTETQIPTATLTPNPPTLTVSIDTYCYLGPGTNYGLVITLHPGTIAVLIGKYSSTNYWIINVPNYPGSTCWISGVNATITGNTNSLTEQIPPTTIPYTLDEPRNLHVSCTSQVLSTPQPWGSTVWTVVFSWANTDPDQTGVRVYRNGYRVATLGRRARSYTDYFFHFRWDDDLTYGVQAFSASAVSSIVTVRARHCG